MPSVAEYRGYAAECLALARKTPLESRRLTLIEMAAAWRDLALLLESHLEILDDEEPADAPEESPAERSH